jgi:hypothetical protein
MRNVEERRVENMLVRLKGYCMQNKSGYDANMAQF